MPMSCSKGGEALTGGNVGRRRSGRRRRKRIWRRRIERRRIWRV
jgi:hypothetical protein